MANSSIIVGVTGNAASGKSQVCRVFERLGIDGLSLDELSRQAVEPEGSVIVQIVEAFGKTVLHQDGTLNRRQLRRLITRDIDAKKALEDIIHPEICRMMAHKIMAAREDGRHLVVEAPLLFEVNLALNFDKIIVVTIPPSIQIKRLVARDLISYDEATALIRIQMPQELKAEKADFVIANNGSLKNLENAAKDIFFKVFGKIADKTP
jgi:dephospho-CoA kinase